MSEKIPKEPEASGKGEGSAKSKPVEPVAESAAAKKPIKNWQFWVTELGADYPLARGACADRKADWDAEINEADFKAALEKFGGGKFGERKPKAGKK